MKFWFSSSVEINFIYAILYNFTMPSISRGYKLNKSPRCCLFPDEAHKNKIKAYSTGAMRKKNYTEKSKRILFGFCSTRERSVFPIKRRRNYGRSFNVLMGAFFHFVNNYDIHTKWTLRSEWKNGQKKSRLKDLFCPLSGILIVQSNEEREKSGGRSIDFHMSDLFFLN